MPSQFPRAARVEHEPTGEDDTHDAPSRTRFWEHSTAETIPGVTRLSTTRIRLPLPTEADTFAEGTNPPRAPKQRSTTRDETAPLD